jgi:signal transduction histidine kinase
MNKLYTKSNLRLFIWASTILIVLAILFAFYLNHVLNSILLEFHQLSITPKIIDEIVYKMRLNSLIWVFLYLILSVGLIFAIANRYFVGPMEELRKMSETIENTQGLLVQQEKLASIGHLAAGVAHELNNPIGFVNSNIAALKDYTTELESYIKFLEGKVDRQVLENCDDNDIEFILSDMPELVEESLDGLSRVTSIVKSLKDYARVDLNDRVDYDINEGLVATLTVSRNTYKYIADIHKDLSHVPPLVVNGNQINEVLLNLIVNAAQAIEEKNENEKGRIEVKTYADDTHVYCSIKDNGSGIETEHLGQIFDPFFTTKEPGKGTGLGLNIAYNIVVNKHGGELNVESTVGVGTEFIIKLPLERELEVDEGN